MNIRIDPEDQRLLEDRAREQGRDPEDLARELFHKALRKNGGAPSDGSGDRGAKQVQAIDELIRELDALPDEPDTDGLSGSMDHDEIIYGKPTP